MMTKEDLTVRINEAETALHELMLGKKVVSVTTEGLGKTDFNQTNIPHLQTYIANLKNQLNKLNGVRRRGTFSLA